MNFPKQLQDLTARVMNGKDITTHVRINDILLGPLERPALRWLAAHTPARVTPDNLTSIGMLGSVIIFFGFWLTSLHPGFLWMASLGFLINWFGDSLDGTLARFRNIQRPRYGFFIDHSLDAVSVVLVFLGLGLSPYARIETAFLALVGYLLVSIHVYIRMNVDNTFKISYAGFGPTEARLLAILTNTILFFTGNKIYPLTLPNTAITFSLYDIVGIFIAAVLAVIYFVSTYQLAQSLIAAGE
jgi:archaetidylinositol phosphate synthase